ncbi:NTE family protein [Duganella sp. SG902]|uniref:patatin-like phospholipase family protein n=1 Tax=Duganella sp. SG902 TaxID=2587016 RepID=UPI00159DEA72|nr:patatin-like phospholipase family protein [Duganella sp. SG902]NVM77512.1 NTE family protein [Duganella sp. SG902]
MSRADPAALDGECVLVLQGGGALGSYQAGVFEALAAARIEPNWLAGISIGAINSALIAGNPPGKRVERLREFWEQVSSAVPELPFGVSGPWRAKLNEASALQVMLFGVPGFFVPRLQPAQLQPRGSPGAISHYDTAPLKATLERLVDFDRINHGATRLSVGVVNVRTGNFSYFDSNKHTIDARHIMASGALPPGFPPVEIDGEHYWDGGLVSNTPLQYVLDQPGGGHRTVFQVDLFPALGDLPDSIGRVAEREKDIRYSSRTRMNTDVELQWRATAESVQRLLAKLPADLRDDPDARQLAQLRPTCSGLDIVHLIYRTKAHEHDSKDYEFSRWTMREHWEAGRGEVQKTLADPRWLQRGPGSGSVRVIDAARGTA